MWRLGTITSRVLVLVLYSTVYTYWVFLVVTLHWVTMMLWVLSRYAAFNKTKTEKLSRLQEVGLSIFVSYIHIFCYVNLEEQSTKVKIITFYSIMLVENILLLALWTLGERVTTSVVGWDRDKIFIAVSASFVLGLVFMVIYYKYFHVRKIAAALSVDTEPGREEKARAGGRRLTSAAANLSSDTDNGEGRELLSWTNIYLTGNIYCCYCIRPRGDGVQLRAEPRAPEEEEDAVPQRAAPAAGQPSLHTLLEGAPAQVQQYLVGIVRCNVDTTHYLARSGPRATG